MREAAFVEQNKQKWIEFQNDLKNKSNKQNPDKLAIQYNELTNDLAYAQTFYTKSKTKEFLNELAIFAHQSIYKDKKHSFFNVKYFFSNKVPKAFYSVRYYMILSLFVFALGTFIGWISSVYDDTFIRFILGNEYVDSTIDRIKQGNPAGIYGENSAIGSFLGITINNISVAFKAFILGIFFSFISCYILFQNGIMLGAFHYMFYKYNVLSLAMSAIWIHGAFEISVIIIAGGCGIALGQSFIITNSYSRKESFINTIKKTITILISVIPFFIFAGFLEGFITRYYKFNIILSMFIIILSLFIVIYYYIFLPLKIKKTLISK